jgi:hypothetical protein
MNYPFVVAAPARPAHAADAQGGEQDTRKRGGCGAI